MADGQVPRQGGQLVVVEDVGDETHVLVDGDDIAVGHGHAGRLLTSVLQGVEPVVGQVGHRLARGVDPEDAARFLGFVVVGIGIERDGATWQVRHVRKATVRP